MIKLFPLWAALLVEGRTEIALPGYKRQLIDRGDWDVGWDEETDKITLANRHLIQFPALDEPVVVTAGALFPFWRGDHFIELLLLTDGPKALPAGHVPKYNIGDIVIAMDKKDFA